MSFAITRGNHHLAEAVDRPHSGAVDLQKTVTFGKQTDLSLFDFSAAGILALAQGAENFRGFIFMEGIFVIFPDVEIIFPEAEEDGNVFLRHDMPLSESGVFCDASDNLCDIMAQNHADGILCTDFFHNLQHPFDYGFCPAGIHSAFIRRCCQPLKDL